MIIEKLPSTAFKDYEAMVKKFIFYFLKSAALIFSYIEHRKFLSTFILIYAVSLGLNSLGIGVWLPSCPIFAFTGFECLGCGTNRALISLLTLDVGEAWQLNKLIFFYIPVVLFFLVKDFYQFSIDYTHSKQNNNYGKI